jgi:dTDP-4-amino-4,6-dideoxygalactose transaminase
MKVPFLDMKARHAAGKREFLQAIGGIIDSGDFCGDAAVEEFEREFAAYCGCRHAVSVGSGTDALWLTMRAMGIGPGDEVITVPMTYMATIEAILMTGAKPVFVDIEEMTYTMDPAGLERAVSPRTKGILPVHLFGQPASMAPVTEFARQHGLRVIEDAAQAHGAEYQARKAGSLGHAGCFSFYPSKNLGAFGDGGAVVTDNDDLAGNLRVLRNHGQPSKNRHAVLGWNSRLDGIQAAVLRIKLRDLDAQNARRRAHAARYHAAFEGVPGIIRPECAADRLHVHHIHAIRTRDRRRMLEHLAAQGIECGVHYPLPAHLQPALSNMGFRRGDFPVSERCAAEFISLPMFAELTAAQIDCVVEAVMEASGAFASA